MHGDRTPLVELHRCKSATAGRDLSIDDAHGMSWRRLGQSLEVLGFGPMCERMVVALGLSKAFAVTSAALVFSDQETRRFSATARQHADFFGAPKLGQLEAEIALACQHREARAN